MKKKFVISVVLVLSVFLFELAFYDSEVLPPAVAAVLIGFTLMGLLALMAFGLLNLCHNLIDKAPAHTEEKRLA